MKSITTLIADVGGRVDWLEGSELIAYDRLNSAGYFDVWTMRSDGSRQTCLTCGDASLPSRHKGNPAWHPSGKYILFQALDDAATGPLVDTDVYRIYTNPGAGFRNVLWLISSDGKKKWQMTDAAQGVGVLHPHFSHDGRQAVWAEMTGIQPQPMGSWVIRMADFDTAGGVPSFRNLRALAPGNFQWYETHGFSPDDRELLFTAMPFGGTANDYDLYRFNLGTGALTALTSNALEDWDEHGHFLPDGKRIIWMSSMGTLEGVPLYQLNVRTEYWLMDADGQNKIRLTGFNDPTSPHYRAARVIASDHSLSSDGLRFVAYIQVDPTADRPGDIVLIQLSKE